MDQTEYKRSFIWSKPMVEAPPAKPEPMISNYQMSYGRSLSDHVDGRPSDHLSKSISSTDSRSPTPGAALREPVYVRAEGPAPVAREQPIIPTGPSPAEQIGQGPAVLFSYEPSPRPPSPLDPTKQSEYHAKFKPFDEYVYVEGERKFKKQTNATKLVAASSPPASAAKAWFVEVEERCKQACKYRARSQNGEFYFKDLPD